MAAGVGRFDVIAPPVMCFPVCPAPLGIHQSGVLLQCAVIILAHGPHRDLRYEENLGPSLFTL